MFKFQKAVLGESGISRESIEAFINRLNEALIPMHSILIFHKDKLITEAYYKPYKDDTLHRMFSITKSFVSIAIGLLIDEGKISLEDKIVTYFPDLLPKEVDPWLSELTIRNMLMMRTCYSNTTYTINKTLDWTRSYFEAKPDLPPGRLFHYDTSSAQTMCALVERITGMPLLEYIKKKLAVLDFSEESYVLKDPVGTSIGGSGLMATPMDMMKFGYFLLKKGNIDGKQLISKEYIELATSNLSDTRMLMPVKTEKNGYGMQFWRYDKNGYMCYGMGGQFIIVIPDMELILVTTADTQSVAGGNQVIHTAFIEEIVNKIPKSINNLSNSTNNSEAGIEKSSKNNHASNIYNYSKEEISLHKDFLNNLMLAPLQSMSVKDSKLVRRANGKTYKMKENAQGFDNFCIKFERDYGILNYSLNGLEMSHPFGIGKHIESDFPKYNMHCASSASIIDDNTLYVKIECLDAFLGIVNMEFSFIDNTITVDIRKIEESIFTEYNCLLYGEINCYYSQSM